MIAETLTFAFDTLLWTGALIALVLVLRRPVARHFGPGLAYALWLLPLARLALPPLVLPANLLPKGFAPAATNPVPEAAGAGTVVTTVTIPAEPVFALPWELLLGSAWLGGAALFLIARVLEYRAMRRALLAGSVEVDRREGVRLVETPAVSAPVAFGLRDKVVALPPRFLISGRIDERALAIEHELAHHRGRDLLANWLAQPLLALHWFNPLAWAAWNAMRRDQEAACDARALAGRDYATRAAYARVIASFAAGERLHPSTALAAPMACPVLGDKSIVHRLRSLTMTEISPRRRRAGRTALAAAAALALPLTATVVYAGQDAPEPPVPVAPVALAAPVAPPSPVTPKVARQVIVVTEHRDGKKPHGDHAKAKYEKRLEKDGKTIVIRSDKPIEEVELEQKLAKAIAMVPPEPPLPPGAPGATGERREFRKVVVHDSADRERRAGHAKAFAMRRCGNEETIADASAGTELAVEGGQRVERTSILLCGKPGDGKAKALAGVRKARDRIAAGSEMSAEVRADILRQLDETIARLEKDGE